MDTNLQATAAPHPACRDWDHEGENLHNIVENAGSRPPCSPHPAETPIQTHHPPLPNTPETLPFPDLLQRAPAISHFPASPTPFSKVIEILTPLNTS